LALRLQEEEFGTITKHVGTEGVFVYTPRHKKIRGYGGNDGIKKERGEKISAVKWKLKTSSQGKRVGETWKLFLGLDQSKGHGTG